MFPSGIGFKSSNLKIEHQRKRKIDEFIIVETLIKVDSEFIWLWIAIKFESKEIIGITIYKKRNMFIAHS
jgi:putative transposase